MNISTAQKRKNKIYRIMVGQQNTQYQDGKSKQQICENHTYLLYQERKKYLDGWF
jgi:hypothetical protein